MTVKTEHYARCIQTLESSFSQLEKAEAGSIEYEVFRNAVVKGFEVTLDMAAKILRKALKAYTGRPRDADALTYKDVLRHAAKHSLVSTEEVERWFAYYDNGNKTANDYGVGFAKETLKLMPRFVHDARTLESVLRERLGHV